MKRFFVVLVLREYQFLDFVIDLNKDEQQKCLALFVKFSSI
jgi:hypothetical protein